MRTWIFTLLAVAFLGFCTVCESANAENSYFEYELGTNLGYGDVAISDDGKYGVVVDFLGGVVSYLETDSGWAWQYNTSLVAGVLAMSDDGQAIVMGGMYDEDTSKSSLYFFTKDGIGWERNVTHDEDEGMGSGNYNGITDVDISDDGQYIVAGSSNNKLYLFSNDGTLLWDFIGTTDGSTEYGTSMNCVSISSNGDYIAAADKEYLYLFHKDNNTPIWSWVAPGYPQYSWDWPSHVRDVDISANGKRIIAGVWSYAENYDSDDRGYVFMFGNEDNTPIWSYEEGSLNPISAVAISADAKYSVVWHVDDEKRMIVFDNHYGTPLWQFGPLSASRFSATVFSMSDDGKYILAADAYSPANQVLLFDIDDNSGPIWSYNSSAYGKEYCSCHSVALSADGKYVLFAAGPSSDASVYVFDSPREINNADSSDGTSSDDEMEIIEIPGPSLIAVTFATFAVALLKRRT